MRRIDFWELDGYPQETRTLKGFSAVRKLVCAWGDRYDLRQLLIAHPGQVYPYIPGFGARVTQIAMTPVGKQLADPSFETMARYESCLLTVTYETPAMEDPQPYPERKSVSKHERADCAISESFEPYAEAQRLDHSLFKWSNDEPLEPDEAPVRVVKRAKYTFTRHNQSGAPEELFDYLGKINSETVTPIILDTVSFPPHTLLFEPPLIATQADDEGQPRFDLTYRFAYKKEGWRKFYRAKAQEYQTIHHMNGEPYTEPEEINFSPLFP